MAALRDRRCPSPGSVKGHLTSIFYKLGVQDRLALALMAIKMQLAPPGSR